jgi:hypothetical protein
VGPLREEDRLAAEECNMPSWQMRPGADIPSTSADTSHSSYVIG